MFEYEDSQYYIFQFQGQMTPTEPLRKGLKSRSGVPDSSSQKVIYKKFPWNFFMIK